MKIHGLHSLFASAAMVLSLAACSSAPKPVESLESARAAYSQSSSDQNIVRLAPTELDAAREALSEADRLWQNDAETPNVDHYANIASQKLEIAQLVADQKLAEQQLDTKKVEQQEAQLSLRLSRTARAHNVAIAFEKQVSEMEGRSTHRGIVTTMNDALFDQNAGSLASAADYKLRKIAAFLKQNPKRRAIIEGHTDSQGDADFNLDLSRDRAYAVRTALIDRGIDAGRLRAIGFGGAAPLNSNGTAIGRVENRRVELTFPDTPMHLSAAQ